MLTADTSPMKSTHGTAQCIAHGHPSRRQKTPPVHVFPRCPPCLLQASLPTPTHVRWLTPRTSDVAGSPGACPGWAWPHRTTRDPVRCEAIPRPFPRPPLPFLACGVGTRCASSPGPRTASAPRHCCAIRALRFLVKTEVGIGSWRGTARAVRTRWRDGRGSRSRGAPSTTTTGNALAPAPLIRGIQRFGLRPESHREPARQFVVISVVITTFIRARCSSKNKEQSLFVTPKPAARPAQRCPSRPESRDRPLYFIPI